MGGILQSKVEERPIADSNEAVKFACDHLSVQFGTGRQPEPQEAYQILRTLNKRLQRDKLIFTNSEGAMRINAVLVWLWYAPNFQELVMNMFRELMRNMELVANKNPLVIRVHEWKYLDELCELLLSLSCSKIYYTLNNVDVLRRNLDSATQQLLEECSPGALSSQFDEDSTKTIFAEKLEKEELQRTYKCLLMVLCEFLKLETATISRSQSTLQITERFASSCFMLFLRLYFHSRCFEELKKRAVKVNNEANLENASYFLGRALSQKNVALFNSAVLFAISLLSDNRTNRQINSLPSHLFPQLPTQSTTNLYDFLFNNVLLALAYEKKEEGRYERRLNCDRFYSYRLLLLLLKNELVVFSQVSVFYLEIICRHVRPSMIERIYLTELAAEAVKLRSSQLLARFAGMDSVDYQITFSNRTAIIKPQQLREYLSNINELLCDELDAQLQQFVAVGLLHQQESTRDDDKLMWEMVIARRKEHIRMTNGNF